MFCDLGLVWWLISWLRACLCLVYGYLGWVFMLVSGVVVFCFDGCL